MKYPRVPNDPRMRRNYATIREYAIALLRFGHHLGEDGRMVGFDYGTIRRLLSQRFPIVTYSGPKKGRPFAMTFDKLWELTVELNAAGDKLPFRPRRTKVKQGA